MKENKSLFLPSVVEGKRPLLGIVGHGYVGSAVESSFGEQFERFIVDPKIGTNIDQLIEAQPHITFVCLPTPMSDSGRINATHVEDAVLKLMSRTRSAVILKSTVTPDIIERIIRSFNHQEDYHRFVYVPEFLKENSSVEDYLNPEFIIIGGMESSMSELLAIYDKSTHIVLPKNNVYMMNPVEASFVKYGINTFLALKVTFFNQLFDVMTTDAGGAVDPWVVNKALLADKRLGNSHWRVPGPDGRRGFGGSCFPKDLSAFINYTSKMTLLNEAKEVNDVYRSEYELSEREEEQNVNYGQAEKEQQD